MPNKNKNRHNNSRKSTTSTSSSKTTHSVNAEDDFGSVLIKIRTPTTSKKTTPKTPRPEFLEPLSPKPVTPPPPPPTPWEQLGMTEADFTAMQERVRKQMAEAMRENLINNLLAQFESPSFWLRRKESLEKEREYFNKKRGWSAMDMVAVDKIDEEIQECDDELDKLYAEEDRLECEYD
jgi:hypothetical protein